MLAFKVVFTKSTILQIHQHTRILSIISTLCASQTSTKQKFLLYKRWNCVTWVRKPNLLCICFLAGILSCLHTSTLQKSLKSGFKKSFGSRSTTRFTTVSLKQHYLTAFHVGVKAFKHPRYGFGIYEGQCDKAGNACGEGRWLCTEPVEGRLVWKGVTLQGCFKGNNPEGFSKFSSNFYWRSYLKMFSDCTNGW